MHFILHWFNPAQPTTKEQEHELVRKEIISSPRKSVNYQTSNKGNPQKHYIITKDLLQHLSQKC